MRIFAELTMNLHESNPAGVIWGAEEIGRVIGRTTRQAFHLLESGQLQGAKKIGGRWAITYRKLMDNFDAGHAAQPGQPTTEERKAPLAAGE
jgi:hypothetical protein